MNSPSEEKPRYVLGLCYSHDASAALLRDGVPVCAIQQERLTRRKHDGSASSIDLRESIQYCLDSAGIELGDLSLVVENSPNVLYCRHRGSVLGMQAPRLLDALPVDRVVQVSHHLAHAHLAYGTSPFESCAVLVADGQGNFVDDLDPEEVAAAGAGALPADLERQSVYLFTPAGWTTLRKDVSPAHRSFARPGGLGHLYELVSGYVFRSRHDAGKLMGLAAFGTPTADDLLCIGEDGSLQFPEAWVGRQVHRPGPSPDQFRVRFQEYANLAASAQAAVERGMVALARWAHVATGQANLAMSGGVVLNCNANRLVRKAAGFDEVFVTPAASDAGISLGCAYYGEMHVLGHPKQAIDYRDDLGRQYSDAEVVAACESRGDRVRPLRPDDVPTEVARRLASGQIGGWFQGGSEFGPRALGHRSILADPRDSSVRRHLNREVKVREGFRPFAPAVLAEAAGDLFDLSSSPFMLETAVVDPGWRSRLGAVVHVDGTSRIQTVRRDREPELHRVIAAFAAETGVPAVVNTSFNGRGEPIVETPDEALDALARMPLDFVAMGPFVVEPVRASR